MKLQFLRTALLSTAGAAILATSAQAAVTTYAEGDLLLGFTGADGTVSKDYVIDIGSASNYIGVSGTIPVNLGVGNTLADLTSVFGSDALSSANTLWSVVGTTGAVAGTGALAGLPANTLFLGSDPSNGALTNTTSNGQGTARGHIDTIGGAFKGQVATSGTNALIQLTSSTNPFISGQAPGGIDGGQDGGAPDFATGLSLTGNFGNGTTGTELDLYELTPAASVGTSGADGLLLGHFNINSAGALTFTAPGAQAVPEPSAYAFGVFAVLLFWVMKRRSDLQVNK